MPQHKGLYIEEELCRDKRQRVTTEHGKNVKSAEIKRDNVAIRFVNWMLTSGRTCRDIKAYVATLKMGRK